MSKPLPIIARKARHVENSGSSSSSASSISSMASVAVTTTANTNEDSGSRSRSSSQSASDLSDKIRILRDEVKIYNKAKYDMVLNYEAEINDLTKRHQICERSLKDYIRMSKEYNKECLETLRGLDK